MDEVEKDRELVREFLNDFKVTGDKNLKVIDPINGKGFGLDTMTKMSTDLFGFDTTYFVEEWYNEKVESLQEDLRNILQNFEVRMTKKGWEILHKETGDVYDVDLIVAKLVHKYDANYIRIICNAWKGKQILKICEEKTGIKVNF